MSLIILTNYIKAWEDYTISVSESSESFDLETVCLGTMPEYLPLVQGSAHKKASTNKQTPEPISTTVSKTLLCWLTKIYVSNKQTPELIRTRGSQTLLCWLTKKWLYRIVR
jgi:hypothetical protein